MLKTQNVHAYQQVDGIFFFMSLLLFIICSVCFFYSLPYPFSCIPECTIRWVNSVSLMSFRYINKWLLNMFGLRSECMNFVVVVSRLICMHIKKIPLHIEYACLRIWKKKEITVSNRKLDSCHAFTLQPQPMCAFFSLFYFIFHFCEDHILFCSASHYDCNIL